MRAAIIGRAPRSSGSRTTRLIMPARIAHGPGVPACSLVDLQPLARTTSAAQTNIRHSQWSAKLEGITGALSTQPNTLPSWKQEVNQRLAAHKNRKGSAPATDSRDAVQSGDSSRAAETAARVAARFAKAPSYSELQAEETRVAVRAAEIATKVALEAQAAAETAVAEMHAAAVEQPSRGPAVVETFAAPVRRQATEQVQHSQAELLQAEPATLEVKTQPATRDSIEHA